MTRSALVSGLSIAPREKTASPPPPSFEAGPVHSGARPDEAAPAMTTLSTLWPVCKSGSIG